MGFTNSLSLTYVKDKIKFGRTTLDVDNTMYVIAFKGICGRYLNLEFQ